MYMLRPSSSNYPGSPTNSQPYGIRTAIYFAQQARKGGGICVSTVNMEREMAFGHWPCVFPIFQRIECYSRSCLSRVARLVLVVTVPVCLLVSLLVFGSACVASPPGGYGFLYS